MALVEASQLVFGYQATAPILYDWNACFEAGELAALTGPSGCGKSTVLYLLGLMLRPSKGHILVDGVDVSSLSDARRAHLRAQTFGFVFQDAALDASRTVIDNVIETSLYRRSSRKADRRRAHELMEQFGVDQRAEHRPGEVSGGQAQRIALCRALLNEPRILLADEPTGNLDHESATTVIDAFQACAARGATVIIASHDPVLVGQCTRVITL